MTTWVLVRGLAREAGHWGAFGQALAERLDARDKVTAVDLPGNGVLHQAVSPASVPATSAALRDMLVRRAHPPYVLVGLSLGAMVALELARRYPGEVAGCVVVNTSAGGSPFWQRLRPRNYWRLARLLLPGLMPLERECRILAMTSCDPARHAAVAPAWAELARRHPVSGGNVLRQLAAAALFRSSPRRPAVPLLLLASAADGLVSPRCSQRLAASWSVPIRLHPAAGHDLALDDPGWVVAQIADWWHAR